MTHVHLRLHPLDRLDREQTLMNRLVAHGHAEVNPQRQVIVVFGALNRTHALLAARDHSAAIPAQLRSILIAGASLVRWSGVPLYEADEWPDGHHTRIGGDGALATGHHPQDLEAELRDAATWVATLVHHRSDAQPAWLTAEPLTELVARTWCLADSLGARAALRELIRDHLTWSA